MNPFADILLKAAIERHGADCVMRAIRKEARSMILEISRSGASEERVAERCEPWQTTCEELADYQ